MATQQDPAQITVSCTTEYPAYKLDDQEKCWGLVTLKAAKYEPDESKRPSLDIVAVIDKSGSMSGEKLFLVKKSLNFFVKNLLERDRLSVITYDTNVTTVFGLLSMDNKNKKLAAKKIEEIQSGSATNLSGGLLQGLRIILNRKGTKNDVASVLLFTDGLANEGITSKAKIIQAMKDPKRYLKTTENEMRDINSLSSGTTLSPRRLQRTPGRSFFSRSLRKVVNFFTRRTQQQVPTQKTAQALPVQQPPQAMQQSEEALQQPTAMQQPAQVLQQPTQALQQPTHDLEQPTQGLQQPTQSLKQPTEVLQHPTEALQTPGDTVQQQLTQASGDTIALQQPEQALDQPTKDQLASQPPDESLKQLAHVQQQAQPEIQSTEAGQQFERDSVQSVPLENDKAVNEEKKDKVDIGASVYTFGFGGDHDPDMLRAISDAANGMYYFIEDEKQISESFGHCFGGLVSTLGQNINLTLELCDGITMDKMHTDLSYTSDDTKQKWKVQLGDMMSEEERDILLMVNLPRSDSLTTSILTSSIKYFCVVDSIYKHSEAEMSVNRSADVKYSPEFANHAIDRQRNRILTTKAMKEALELADQDELELARLRLREEIERIKKSLTKDDELCKVLVEDMETSLVGLQDQSEYIHVGKKTQTNLHQMHFYQRSNRPSECSPYTNMSRNLYMMEFE